MINSKRKGKIGELEWSNKVREHGFDCRRGRQYSGSPDSPDVISEDLNQFHFEVKLTKNAYFYTWMNQAVTDADTSKTPVVAHRKNYGEWHVFMKADDFLNLIKLKQ